MDIREKAIRILKDEDELFYWDMIDPIQTGLAEVIEAEKDGILIKINKTWYLMAKTKEKAGYLSKVVVSMGFNVICVHNDIAVKVVSEECGGISYNTPCYVFVGDMKKGEIRNDLEFRKLDHSYDEFVRNTYGFTKNNPNGLEWAKDLVEIGIYGGFKEGKIIGFIGSHDEGTMGMLEILPEFRRNGYGRDLEQFLANVYIDSGRKPFCHVLETNTVSLRLQRELGFSTREHKRVYWME